MAALVVLVREEKGKEEAEERMTSGRRERVVFEFCICKTAHGI